MSEADSASRQTADRRQEALSNGWDSCIEATRAVGNIPWVGRVAENSSRGDRQRYSRQERRSEESGDDWVSARRWAVDWTPQLYDEQEIDKGRETDVVAEEKDAEAGPKEYHGNGENG